MHYCVLWRSALWYRVTACNNHHHDDHDNDVVVAASQACRLPSNLVAVAWCLFCVLHLHSDTVAVTTGMLLCSSLLLMVSAHACLYECVAITAPWLVLDLDRFVQLPGSSVVKRAACDCCGHEAALAPVPLC